jgi:glycosyltransferase involved in cell wall biosynthesis
MKILLAVMGMQRGGAERVVVDLTAGLVKDGHEVLVFGPSGPLDDELSQLLIQRWVVPERGRSLLGTASGALMLAKVARRMAPDVVHAHNPRVTLLAGVGARLGRFGRRPPVVSTFHGTAHSEYALAARLLRAADTVACVSPELLERLQSRGYPRDRMVLVPNAVTVASPLDAARRAELDAELGLGSGPVIAAVGRLVPQKDHALLLEAVAQILPTCTDLRLLMVGEGELRAALEEQAHSLGLDGVVRFTGLRADARALIARADVVAFSSRWEGMPIVALEAMAAGTPVVATPVEGLQEMARSGAALLAADFTAAALAEPLSALVAHEARREEMAAAGRRFIADHHSAAQMVGAYTRLYATVASSR